MKKFNEYNGFNLSDINKDVLQLWDNEDVFGRSIREREGAPAYVFYEGPPSANGMPGIHHVMARTIKDIFWGDEEDVIQFFPKKSEYVNLVNNCMHLWRPRDPETQRRLEM